MGCLAIKLYLPYATELGMASGSFLWYSPNMKRKAYAYITRHNQGGVEELLVFSRNDRPRDIEVPGGTVDEGETPEVGLLRELVEETGLQEFEVVKELMQQDYFHPKKQEIHHRHFFAVGGTSSIPDTWAHVVTAGENDQGVTFTYFWMPLTKARVELVGELGFALNAESKG